MVDERSLSETIEVLVDFKQVLTEARLRTEAEAKAKATGADCVGCPLAQAEFVCAKVYPTDLLVIGEALGANEVRKGEHFIGISGTVARETASQLGFKTEGSDLKLAFNNAVICFSSGPPPKEAIDHCRTRLFREIEQANPSAVIAAGGSALDALGIEHSNVTSMEGLAVDWAPSRDHDSTPVVASWHPAYVLRNPDAYRDLVLAWEKAASLARGEDIVAFSPEDFEDKVVAQNTATALDELELLLGGSLIACDIETTGFNAYRDKILCVSLSQVGEIGSRLVLPWALVEHSPEVFELLRELLEEKEVVYQNGQFDALFFRANGIKAVIGQDTILQMYTLNEIPSSLELKRACRKYLNAPDWERELKQYVTSKSQSFALIPEPILHEYGSLDAAYTGALHQVVRDKMNADEHWVYNNILLPATNMLLQASEDGILIDEQERQRLEQEYHDRLIEMEQQLKEISGKAYFNPRSVNDKRALLYDKLHLERLFLERGLSRAHVGKTGKVVLEAFEEIPEVALLRDFSLTQKIYGTYLVGLRQHLTDNRLHPKVNIHGTRTGRCSAADPNVLGIPEEKGSIRSLFIPDPGWVLAYIDYSGNELRHGAALSGDTVMAQSFRGGRDFHQEARIRMYGYQPTYSHQQVLDAKMLVFGPFYGRGLPSMARQLGCSLEDAAKFQQAILGGFTRMFEFFKEVRKELHDTGEVRSHYGRRRRWGLITEDNQASAERESRNFSISSPSSDTNLLAMIEGSRQLSRDRARPMWPVHDAGLWQLRERGYEETLEQLKEIYTTLPNKLLKTDVPFAVKVGIGDHWVSA